MVVLANMDATSHEKPSLVSNPRKKRLSCHIRLSILKCQTLLVQHSKLSTHFKINNPSTLQILITHTCPNSTLQKNNFLLPNKVMISNKCGKPYSTNITFQLRKNENTISQILKIKSRYLHQNTQTQMVF
jgi:hypothetical protein